MANAGIILQWAIAGALAVPCGVLVVEVLLALLPARRSAQATQRAPARIAVIVPAHDEETEIAATVAGIRRELSDEDRLLVVADNCGDGTAEVAAEAGADVVERWSDSERGKGYALAFGVDRLRADPPDVVVFMDADCRTEPGALARVAAVAHATGRPAQGLYLMELPRRASPRDRLSAFAFQLKNEVRAGGLAALSLPCHLTGTAMAWPWRTVDEVKLATGSIVEDLELGIALALSGSPALLCRDARVYGRLPESAEAATTQRRRWEHGFLQTALTLAPRLLGRGALRLDPGLFALGLDLCVPPLTLLVALVGSGLVVVAALAALGLGSWGPAAVLAAALLAVGGAVLAAWLKYARRTLPFASLLQVPLYVLWKIPILVSFLWRRERQWVRTARDGEGAERSSSQRSSSQQSSSQRSSSQSSSPPRPRAEER